MRRAYRQLALERHPDRDGGGSDEFIELIDALHAALKDAEGEDHDHDHDHGADGVAGAEPHVPAVGVATAGPRLVVVVSGHGAWKWGLRWDAPRSVVGGGVDERGPFLVRGDYDNTDGHIRWVHHYALDHAERKYEGRVLANSSITAVDLEDGHRLLLHRTS